MSKVTLEGYQLRVSNSSDEEKTYSIECSLNVNNNEVGNIDAGTVAKDGQVVASFNLWGGNNLNVSYMNIEAEEQCVVNTAINEFITAATAVATNKTE